MGLGLPGQVAISSTVATADCEKLLDPTTGWEWQLSRSYHGSMGLPASSLNVRVDLEEISERGYPVSDSCLAQLTEVMFPATMRHGRSEVLPCQVLVELLVASAVARLREAQRGPKVPRWAARVLRACPNHVRSGISQPGSDWEK